MEIKLCSPTNAYNLKPSQIILTSDNTYLVAQISVNDYQLAIVNLKSGNIEVLLISGENVVDIRGSLIMKVYENDQAQLILP